MAADKVSHDTPEDVQTEKQQPGVVLNTLDAKGHHGGQSVQAQPALSRRQAISAYFTIAAAAFGLIRCVAMLLPCRPRDLTV